MKYTKRKRQKRRTKRRTNRIRGGFLGLDPRSSFFPAPIADLGTNVKNYFDQSNRVFAGSYKGIDPNWVVQPRLQ